MPSRSLAAAIVLCLAPALFAQDVPKEVTAGGKWTYTASEDKFTGAPFGFFELKANGQISDGIALGLPSFVIMCGVEGAPSARQAILHGSIVNPPPHWMNSKLLSPVVLGKPDIVSAVHEPQQNVLLRADGKIHMHWWNVSPDFRTLFVDKHATKELLHGSDVRIQFRDASEHRQVAIFSPAGINEEMLTKACGNITK